MNTERIVSISRRILSGLVVSAVFGMTSVSAAAPIETTQVPGFYRQLVGNAVVTAVYDGYVSLDPKSLSGLNQQKYNSISLACSKPMLAPTQY